MEELGENGPDWLSNCFADQDFEHLFNEDHNTEHQHVSKDINGKFWWWDETGADGFGPFDTVPEALASLTMYQGAC